jgi:BASS family bile acid:Na+ symporter
MIVLLTDFVLPTIVFVLMAIVGMELKREDFAAVARRPRSLVVGCLAQIVLAPLAALAIVAIVEPGRALVVALVLLAICPSGALSNLYVLINRGNVALSICLTTLSSLFCIVATPFLALLVFAAILDAAGDLELPTEAILGQLALFVLTPVLLGMFIRYRFPVVVENNRATYMAAAIGFLLMTVAIAVAGSWVELVAIFWTVALLALVFTVCTIVAGRLVALSLHPDDRSTCAIECAVRNIPVALLLAGDMADNAAIVAFAAAYFLVHAPLLVGYSVMTRTKARVP